MQEAQTYLDNGRDFVVIDSTLSSAHSAACVPVIRIGTTVEPHMNLTRSGGEFLSALLVILPLLR